LAVARFAVSLLDASVNRRLRVLAVLGLRDRHVLGMKHSLHSAASGRGKGFYAL